MSRFKIIRSKLAHLLDNNKFLAVLSVVIAVMLWCFVGLTVNTEGYSIIKDVPIKFTTNNEALGFTVITNDISDIDIVVHGNRLVVGVLTASDFNVTADYSNVTEAGNYNLNIEVGTAVPTADYSISSYSSKSVAVMLDKVISKKYEIQTELIKATVAEGYVLQKPALTKTETILTGPESEINQIQSCVAKVNINAELTESKTKLSAIEYRNADGAKITPQHISADITEVEVTVSVLKEKEVKVVFAFTNLPAGFSSNTLAYTLSQETLKIAGPKDTVDSMTEVNIGYIDVSDLSLDGKVELKVELPSGIINLEEIDVITVNFDFSGYMQKVYSTTEIKVVNAPADYEITLLTKKINNINIIGSMAALTSITSSNIVAEINLSNIGEVTLGTQTVPVRIVITTDKTAWAIGEYTANISVKQK